MYLKNVLHTNSILKDSIIVFNEKWKFLQFLTQKRLIHSVKISINTCHSSVRGLKVMERCLGLEIQSKILAILKFLGVSVDIRVRIQSEFSTSELLQGQVNWDKKCHICVAGTTAFQKMFWSGVFGN